MAEEVGLQQGIVIGTYLIKVLKEKLDTDPEIKGLSAPDIDEDKAVFVTCFDGRFCMYINPRILQSGKGILLEHTDEYGNFNIKEYHNEEAETLQYLCQKFVLK